MKCGDLVANTRLNEDMQNLGRAEIVALIRRCGRKVGRGADWGGFREDQSFEQLSWQFWGFVCMYLRGETRPTRDRANEEVGALMSSRPAVTAERKKPFCFGPSTAASNGQIHDKVPIELLFNLCVKCFCICKSPVLIFHPSQLSLRCFNYSCMPRPSPEPLDGCNYHVVCILGYSLELRPKSTNTA